MENKYNCFIILLIIMANTALFATPNPPIVITKEAEEAVLFGSMESIWDGSAFNNHCIHGYPSRVLSWAELEVDVETSADYVIWGRVLGMDGFTNSFGVSVDRGPEYLWDINKNYQWEWERVSDRGSSAAGGKPEVDPVVIHLSAGKHVIAFRARERFAKLDRIVLTDSKSTVFTEQPVEWIDIKNPRYAQVVVPGSTIEIKWTSQILSDKVNIDLSRNGGKNFRITVAHNLKNTGSFMWTVPADLKVAHAILKVANIAGDVYDINFGYFAIVDPNDPDIGVRLGGPEAGQEFYGGSVYFIVLDRYFFNGFVNFSYSIDNGVTWIPDGFHCYPEYRHFWHIPDTPSSQCLYRVEDYYGNYVTDISPVFTIKKAPLPPAPPKPEAQPITTLEVRNVPAEFDLAQNYPNPFNPQTTIDYSIAAAAHVELKVYDLLGKQVAELVNGFAEPGQYQIQWNAGNMPTGVYVYRLVAGQHVFNKKMTLVK